MKQLLMTGAAALVLTACGGQEASQTAASVDIATLDSADVERVAEPTSRDDWGAFGLDLYSMDTATEPGDDFFRFVNGTWYDE
ncbi:MAG: M13 family peptidase, partial [Pseudomonadota bacterium]